MIHLHFFFTIRATNRQISGRIEVILHKSSLKCIKREQIVVSQAHHNLVSLDIYRFFRIKRITMTILSTLIFGVTVLSLLDPIDAHKTVLGRPNLHWGPKTPGHPFPHSPKRYKTCYVPSCRGSGRHGKNDDAPEILKAFKKCNRGGVVVLDEEYTIASPLDLTFLEAVDVAITGSIKFTNDIDYWVKNSFKYDFQNSSAFWRFGGKDVNIYGGGKGLIDGNGQAWYDAFAAEPTLLRPILLVLDGLERGSVTGLKMRNSPDASNS